jgi:KDO2-lipid IV(A) lauroyltransferase
MTFLNQPTPVITGFEHFAKEYDTPVLFLSMERVKRGYYEGTFHHITDTPRQTKDGEIVEAYMQLLEKKIHARPAHWLWSHRRWKVKPDDADAAARRS